MKFGNLDRFPRLEAIAASGAVIVLKVDGERIKAANPDIFTVVLSGGELDSQDYFRKDGDDLDQLVEAAIAFYDAHKN